jgi:hypothetical protein
MRRIEEVLDNLRTEVMTLESYHYAEMDKELAEKDKIITLLKTPAKSTTFNEIRQLVADADVKAIASPRSVNQRSDRPWLLGHDSKSQL